MSHSICDRAELLELQKGPPSDNAKAESPEPRLLLGLGGSYWDTGDVSTETGSTIDPGAFTMQLGFEVAIADHKTWGFGLGMDFGYSLSDVDGPTRSTGWFTSEEDSSADVWWVTPTANFYFPGDGATFVARAGIGYYRLEVEALESLLFFPPTGTRTVISEWTIGGFVGAAFELDAPWPHGIGRLDYKLHFVSFDGGDDVRPPGASFDAPMHTLLLAFGFKG